ncbi:polyketide synthase PksN [Marininema halotolerans]|uniref:Polyketide synthase PksN n=1 Tax=Marininema halotolerans TaxID=1155944 RepID=A0A1I6PQE2_9BACL|nr:type I polyketide synthase [Marininema halotolerans]SFS42429.1 polyketide synthase PksN [Marininema halotolerans]
MRNELQSLVQKIKEGTLSHDEAAEQFRRLEEKLKTTTADDREQGAVLRETAVPTDATNIAERKWHAVLKERISHLLHVREEDIEDTALVDLGLDPIQWNELAHLLNQQYDLTLTSAALMGYSSLDELAQSLGREQGVGVDLKQVKENDSRDQDHNVLEGQEVQEEHLWQKAIEYVKGILSPVIKLPVSRIQAEDPLEKFGIDSLMALQLTDQLEKPFGPLPKTLFFEYQSVRELTGYFMANYREPLMDLLGLQPQAPESTLAIPVKKSADPSGRRVAQAVGTSVRAVSAPVSESSLDMAIIGLSGRYPGAKNMQQYWENLRNGKDCITEIPKERWDHRSYPYSKWGGFLEEVDCFDPLFFRISPREAELMDPQERLFIESVYETLEDAGYTRQSLSEIQQDGLGGRMGVFVGAMYQEYQLYGAQEQIQGNPLALSGNASAIANRVSYLCNFHGPSLAVDTMCSSSLTAIHLACRSIGLGDCEMAIAGGVNLSIHPNKYLALSKGKFVSSNGRCESFGQGGDGYIPGEGVGSVLIKPLSKAIADHDHIYGVIKGSAINHGGKTNSFTVPNINAQADAIQRALHQSGVDPRAISYMEAHGTGTSLGDPIEIAGLTKAFQRKTTDRQFCSIGSAKSNIGHCESAAGIAGLTKILLQMKYGQLVPSLHATTLNPHIDFMSTPFHVQQQLAEWKRPVIEKDGEKKQYPRVAGLSSFGAGGANAHIIVEEYRKAEEEQSKVTVSSEGPSIVVLSAKTRKQLRLQVERLLTKVQEPVFSNNDLVSLAYTLQTGREALEERLAMTVNSLEELEHQLQAFLDHREVMEGLVVGQVKRQEDTLSIFEDSILQESVDQWIQSFQYDKIADLWVKGFSFDWHQIYGKEKPYRISLPTYPFARERFWAPQRVGDQVMPPRWMMPLHPFVHQNTSLLSKQRYRSSFTGREFFLEDHVIHGHRMMPGVAYLEMACAATREALGEGAADFDKPFLGMRLHQVVWARPASVEKDALSLHITLSQASDEGINYEIYSESHEEQETVLHSRGYVEVVEEKTSPPTLDLSQLQAECYGQELSVKECYDTFHNLGITYGPRHQALKELYKGDGQVLAKLSIPSAVRDTLDSFQLHPSMIDAAFQAMVGLQEHTKLERVLPYALEEVEIFSACTPTMWAWVRNAGRKVDIDVCDEQGRCVVRIKGISCRAVQNPVREASECGVSSEMLTLYSDWKEQSLQSSRSSPAYGEHWVLVLGADEAFCQRIQREMSRAQCIPLLTDATHLGEQFQQCATQVFEKVQGMLQDHPKEKILLQLVIPTKEDRVLFTSLEGLLKTASLENPHLLGQVIEIESVQDSDSVVKAVKESSSYPEQQRIRYQGGKREVECWREIDRSTEEKMPWKQEGVYLITGGLGGLGALFAQEISQVVTEGVLILTGRSELSNEKKAQLEKFASSGTRVIYQQVDVMDQVQVEQLFKEIKLNFGKLNGIIHSAGVVRDRFIIKKTAAEFNHVMGAKVTGLVHLDEASRGFALDFFALFSSIASVNGNPGQADYATANAFMDAYAGYRNRLVANHQRSGQTVSINWPLWKEGGMKVPEETEARIQKRTGLIPLRTATGIQAFYRSVTANYDRVLVFEGETQKIKEVFPYSTDDGMEKKEDELTMFEAIAEGSMTEEEFEAFLYAT